MLAKALLIVACGVLVLSMAYAQENRKNEIGLLLGATVTPALDVSGLVSNRLEIGSGITFQLTYARRLARTRS